jgi:hypothetical protein
MGLTVHFEVLNQLGTPMMYSSSLATRPAAGIQGRIFFRTDSPYGIYRDNGTSWDQIAGSGGGGIGGSGTATQIAYFSAATTLASSANLFWDNTNGRLGVNTNTPGSSLDIHSAVQSIIQANNTTLGNSFASFQLQGTGKWQIGNVYSAGDNYFRIQDQLNTLERFTIRNTGQIDFLGYTQILNTITGITGTTPSALPNNYYSNNFTYNSGITTVASVNTIGLDVDNSLNYSGANTINSTSYNTSILQRNLLTFGSASASITYTQATGIRALCNEQVQYFQSGANSGTISHYANIQILGDNKTGAGLTTFTNRYGILINDFNEFTAGNTYTNRWGIYQAGLNENNFFAGKVGIGSGFTPSTLQLDVLGTARIQDNLSVSKNQNAVTLFSVTNTTNGTAAQAAIGLTSNSTSGNAFFGKYSTLKNPFKIFAANDFYFTNEIGGDIAILNDFATGKIKLAAGASSTAQVTITPAGRLLVGTTTEDSYIVDGNGRGRFTGLMVGVTASDKAILQADSNTRGFLPPRMTSTEKNAITSVPAGLILFDTTLNKLCVYTTAWETVTSI